MSSRVNDALHRLSSPLRRVEYILEREGYHVGDHESLEDPEVLMETMEMREQIESAESKEEVERVQAANGGAYICHILSRDRCAHQVSSENGRDYTGDHGLGRSEGLACCEGRSDQAKVPAGHREGSRGMATSTRQ